MEKIYLGGRNKKSVARLYVEPLFERYFKPLFPDSLFLILHTSPLELPKVNFNSYRYIFLVQVSDPADYVGKNWDYLYKCLYPYLNKTFAVCNYYSKVPFRQISIDCPLMFAISNNSCPDHPRNHLKKYLCLNNRDQPHKTGMVNSLIRHDVFKDGFVSLTGSYSLPSESSLNKVSASVFANQLLDSSVINPFPIEFFQTPFNLVTETTINKHQMYISEKTVKPILAKQLILHVGSPRTIEYLNKQYDLDIPIFLNNWLDLDEICNFLKRPLDELNQLYLEHSSALEKSKTKLQNHCTPIFDKLILDSFRKHGIVIAD